jgi:hypothetical protein
MPLSRTSRNSTVLLGELNLAQAPVRDAYVLGVVAGPKPQTRSMPITPEGTAMTINFQRGDGANYSIRFDGDVLPDFSLLGLGFRCVVDHMSCQRLNHTSGRIVIDPQSSTALYSPSEVPG